MNGDEKLHQVLEKEPEWPDTTFEAVLHRAHRARAVRTGAVATVALIAIVALGVVTLSLRNVAAPGFTKGGPNPTASGTSTCDLLHLGVADGISEPTGQHTAVFSLRNDSGTQCSLEGYPGILLLDAKGTTLEFIYGYHAPDQVITNAQPKPLRVAPGGTVYFTLNKYRCDAGDKAVATKILVTIPGASGPLSIRLPNSTGAQTLAYCGPGDPGSTIDVSPFEATITETLSH
jgi:hypothetical protein